MAIPYTHNLDDLLDLLLPHDSKLRVIRRGLGRMTSYAVDLRYPGENATTRETKAALKLTERVRREIRSRLGLPEARPRKN